MNYSKHVKKILLDGAESKVVRKGVAVQIFKFRLFVRDRAGIWRQITEDTKLANPVLVIYDAKRGGVLHLTKRSGLSESTARFGSNSMLQTVRIYSGAFRKVPGWRPAVGLYCRFIPTNANNCSLHNMTSERIGNPELKATIKCVHEYNQCIV